MLENIMIQAIDNCNLIVKADTIRFGKNAIVYQNISLKQCCEYIAKATGKHSFKLRDRAITVSPSLLTPDLPAMYCGKLFKDFDGVTVPEFLDVVF